MSDERVERWMSTGTAARALDVSRITAWRWAATGVILARRKASGRLEVAFPIVFLREFDRDGKENVSNVSNVSHG